MANKVLEVLADEVNVPRAVGKFTNPDDPDAVLYQHIDTIRYAGDKISLDDVSPQIVEILEDSDHPLHESVSKKVKISSGSPGENVAARLGLPFDGYEDLDEEEVVGLMHVLPSPTVQAIKRYESENENRPRIAQYNIGLGVSPSDHAEGNIGSDVQDTAEGKPSAKIQTRVVKGDSVTPGEGVTGTGDPDVPYGTAEEEGELEVASRSHTGEATSLKGGSGSKKRRKASSKSSGGTKRRSRRGRTTAKSKGSSDSSEGSSGE